MNISYELQQMKLDLGLIKKQFCTDKEQLEFKQAVKLPDDVFHDDFTGKYVRYINTELPNISDHDLEMLIHFKQEKRLNSIRKYLLFFVVLTVIQAVAITILFIPYL